MSWNLFSRDKKVASSGTRSVVAMIKIYTIRLVGCFNFQRIDSHLDFIRKTGYQVEREREEKRETKTRREIDGKKCRDRRGIIESAYRRKHDSIRGYKALDISILIHMMSSATAARNNINTTTSSLHVVRA